MNCIYIIYNNFFLQNYNYQAYNYKKSYYNIEYKFGQKF